MNRKGVVLVISFMVIVVLTILSVAIVSRSISESNIAKRYAWTTQAFWLAESGIEMAFWELTYNNCRGSFQYNERLRTCSSIPCGNCATCGYSICFSQDFDSLGNYSAVITDPDHSGSSISVTGVFLNRNTPGTISRTIIMSKPGGVATLGKRSIVVAGSSRVDSYNSVNGAYGGVNKFSHGHVVTNGNTNGAITIGGSSQVDGNASTAPGGTVNIIGSAGLTGTITNNNKVSLESVTIPVVMNSLVAGGRFFLAGSNKQVFNAGDYKYDSISIAGSSTLTFNGNVRIYLTNSSSALSVAGSSQVIVNGTLTIYTNGPVTIAGASSINRTNYPRSFKLYATSTANNITIAGSATFYGAVYAPDINISIAGSSNVFGSVVGNQITIAGSSKLHYDEALGWIGQSSEYTWREAQNPYRLSP